MPELDNTSIAWKILFNEDFERIPDPNDPANIPRLTAQMRERRESLERLMTGQGRVLFEQWRDRLKRGLLSLLVAPPSTPLDTSCHCSSCQQLREMRIIFALWLEAQRILEGKKDV